jgi:putative intracellular protease/amidase
MTIRLFLILLSIFTFNLHAQSANDEALNEQQVRQTLTNYIEGTSYNRPEQIEKAFYESAPLYLSKKDKPLWTVPAKEYISWFGKNPGQFNGRVGEIISLDITGGVALAKAEILMPKNNVRFVDLFILKKLASGWKIMSKTATKSESNAHGKRILFIVSNAHFYGDSNIKAGSSFSEIVNAYDEFKRAGYTVDFVSPKGGAIPLAYINTSQPLHKSYLYNSDFMYALGHTKTPTEVVPANYRAVHYIGGSNAIFGVAENKAIQNISMEIYEKHNGIISAVCHGTAGIVNLTTKDGQYLVSGKVVSGYPEAYENQSAAYFKQFPFLIQKTIEQRNGTFKVSPRNTAHVEVDGRLVTGQNHLSSRPVAAKIIELLEQG